MQLFKQLIVSLICVFPISALNAQNIEAYVTTSNRECLFQHIETIGRFSDFHN